MYEKILRLVVIFLFLTSCDEYSYFQQNEPTFGSPQAIIPDYYYKTNPTVAKPADSRFYKNPYEIIPLNNYHEFDQHYVAPYGQYDNFHKLENREEEKERESEHEQEPERESEHELIYE